MYFLLKFCLIVISIKSMYYEFPHYTMIFSISYSISPTSDYHYQLFVVRTHGERYSISRGSYSLASLVSQTVHLNTTTPKYCQFPYSRYRVRYLDGDPDSAVKYATKYL